MAKMILDHIRKEKGDGWIDCKETKKRDRSKGMRHDYDGQIDTASNITTRKDCVKDSLLHEQ